MDRRFCSSSLLQSPQQGGVSNSSNNTRPHGGARAADVQWLLLIPH